MSAWESSVICGIYTVTPLHVSSGQAEGAIDLPAMKESHTGLPVIPASALKGVARDSFTRSQGDGDSVKRLFGPDLSDDEEKELHPGALVFTEARLIAYAARSLNRPFVYVTSRFVLERLLRDVGASGQDRKVAERLLALPSGGAAAMVSEKGLAGGTLVVEDLVYSATRGEVAQSADLNRVARVLGGLLPAEETDARSRFARDLVLIPDDDFSMLVRRLPVRARIKLNERKTTTGDGGNLWYEEQVPPDCLFAALVGERKGWKRQSGAGDSAIQAFRNGAANLAVCQLGGNETVGEGVCFWTCSDRLEEPVKENV